MSERSPAGRNFRVIAVQPQWSAADFTSAVAFRAWMRSQLETARSHLAPGRPNLVVLTELNGLPLVLRGSGWVTRLGTFQRAATALFLARLPRVLPLLLRERVSPIRALQLADSAENVRLYLDTCRDLAREYGVYLCCGSTPMPRYRLEGRRLVREPRTLHNETVLLDPRGDLIGVTDKVHLTPDEEAGGVDLTPGPPAELRVFPAPVGDLGVAISLDAFRADVIGRLEDQGCTVLLQPDANGAPWTSLEGLPPDPTNVRDQPVAWLESSWQATAGSPTIRYAVNPMVVGNLLDLTFDGQSAITARAEEAPELRSYVLTDPRPGFLALLPWVEEGPAERLRELGRHLAARSGHPHENCYRTGVLYADLSLPPSHVSTPPRTAHEEALAALLEGRAALPRSRPLWPLLGLATLLWVLRRR
ncbi:carbon-nitrogen hydrolase family protein [Deinococcus metallilatus]|uniref:Amidohydrolase n=1 Tax=Deinococcus metallilatus TaxID=1211322 RepID=A0AAJ5F1W0_9DEIO|nr:nitrilase-related carbon-nitrogen hydrolase [Deinococcus metallilatus]MBB5296798.1 putative amidohydrolase [Deinococcus metallilatus]QBY09540.1 carbon-nitrogen hydrolase family protein [Deinococcus metallilatus]RXJ09144.1 carbon-nitrogen hydrolase family protein [Deinococcus metallilatus]TLK22812.1 carbon-nitrogen hydrolase family protein [Deinococcus metallilatus]GMA13830.1 carbon-nitrogen hydrolase family protein [Deinococcus metallilatus]